MSTNLEGSPADAEAITLLHRGDPEPSLTNSLAAERPACVEASAAPTDDGAQEAPAAVVVTLASLPPGARLILRCRKDWRAAAVSSVEPDCVRLSVASPTGHTYRVRRPHDSVLAFEGHIPILSDRDSTGWRVALARYDARW